MAREEWDRVLVVNFGGTFNCTRRCSSTPRGSRRNGSFNVASVAGRSVNFGQAKYAASKSGLFGLTKTLAI